MAKHTGVTIRIGAAYDTVQVDHNGETLVFDRAALSKQRVEGGFEERKDAKEALYQIRKQTVDAFVQVQQFRNKDKRRQRIARKQRDQRHAA